MTASGESYDISVTYGPEASIPRGAVLEAEEILEGTAAYDNYIEKSLDALSSDEVTAEITRADKSLLKFKPELSASGDGLSLSEILGVNRDVRAWLTLDDTGIDYPIVQGQDNSEYLNKDVFGNFSLSGSLFLDSRSSSDFTDTYSHIYGHHMDANAMFGGLDHFLDDSFFTAHPRGTLILEHTAYAIDLFAAIRADAYDEIIFDPTATTGDTEPLMKFIRTQAVQYREPDLPADARILGLSTCSDASSNARVIVFGLLTEYSESRPEDAADDQEP